MILLIFVSIFGALICIVSMLWAYKLGSTHPSTTIKEKIATEATLNHFALWYNNKVWTCVAVNKNGVGFKGTPANNILVEHQNGERVLLFGYISVNIVDRLRSRPATDHEMSKGIWVSPTNRYIAFEKTQVTPSTSHDKTNVT